MFKITESDELTPLESMIVYWEFHYAIGLYCLLSHNIKHKGKWKKEFYSKI